MRLLSVGFRSNDCHTPPLGVSYSRSLFLWGRVLSGAHGAGGDAEVHDGPATCPGAQSPGAQCPPHALSLEQAL
jgi:hypothetical protein